MLNLAERMRKKCDSSGKKPVDNAIHDAMIPLMMLNSGMDCCFVFGQMCSRSELLSWGTYTIEIQQKTYSLFQMSKTNELQSNDWYGGGFIDKTRNLPGSGVYHTQWNLCDWRPVLIHETLHRVVFVHFHLHIITELNEKITFFSHSVCTAFY